MYFWVKVKMGGAFQYAWHTRMLHQSNIIIRIDQNFDRHSL